MFVRLDLPENPSDPNIAINHKCGPLYPHVLLSVHAFFDPDAVGIDDALVSIGE